jgi:Ca2+-binding RTX toxin-like protein
MVRRVQLEQLEPRQLLAINVTPEGVLSVSGRNKYDRIALVLAGNDLQVTVNKQSQTVPLAGLTAISIASLKGNDRITVDPDITLPAKIAAGGGNDWVWAGGGNDTIAGGWGNDRIDGGAGDDFVFGETGNDQLTGYAGNDTLNGGAGNDWLLGGDGDDVLAGEWGVDHLNGEADNDIASGGDKNDVIVGGSGSDVLYGGNGNDVIAGTQDDDQLFGDSGKDKLYGDDGNDELHGGWGGDLLNGGAGDDLLDGDQGSDQEFNGTSVNLDVELVAVLSSPGGVSGQANFLHAADETGGVELELEIKFEGAEPLVPLDVTIDGNLVGSITPDENGIGKLKFSTDPDDDGDGEVELAFPGGFSLHANSTILIGLDITGTFAVPV